MNIRLCSRVAVAVKACGPVCGERLADGRFGLAVLASEGGMRRVARGREGAADGGASGGLRPLDPQRDGGSWVSLQAGVAPEFVCMMGTELVCCCDRECMGARERLRV